MDENDNKTEKCKQSFGLDKKIGKALANSAPGGVFCVDSDTLHDIGYFNYMPLGGGDMLFWSELTESVNIPWIYRLCVRENVKRVVMQKSSISGKKIIGDIFVDVCHFFHGDFKNRTYGHRDFMLATQYPWNDRLVTDDDTGLY